jgi:antitoxin ParD1/3/4
MGLNVTLDDDLARYVEAQVNSGAFSSASQVVANALRVVASVEQADALLDDLSPEQIAWLRTAWEQGLKSGDAGPLDMDAIKQEARRRFEAGR